MRHLFPLVLATLVSCSGGGSTPPPSAEQLNPAPEPAAASAIAMDGVWRITHSQLASASSDYHTEFPVGYEVRIAGNSVIAVGLGAIQVSSAEMDIEQRVGLSLDWYGNAGDGANLNFGFGWDRLRVAGGAGALADYYQYGFRFAAVSPDLLIAFEAEQRQTFLGEPRTTWLASHILARVP